MELQHIMGTTEKKTGEKTGMECLAGTRDMRPGLQGCLINTERNGELLKDIPHREFLDLSLIYLEELGSPGEILRCQAVDKSCLDKWGVEESSLYEAICWKMENSGEVFLEKMDTILRHGGILEGGLATMPVPLYVLGNKSFLWGAVNLMNKRILKCASDIIGSDFIILPSSIHELILLPDTWEAGNPAYAQELAAIVQQVNDSQVPESDILSYHVYHYNKDTAEVTIIA